MDSTASCNATSLFSSDQAVGSPSSQQKCFTAGKVTDLSACGPDGRQLFSMHFEDPVDIHVVHNPPTPCACPGASTASNRISASRSRDSQELTGVDPSDSSTLRAPTDQSRKVPATFFAMDASNTTRRGFFEVTDAMDGRKVKPYYEIDEIDADGFAQTSARAFQPPSGKTLHSRVISTNGGEQLVIEPKSKGWRADSIRSMMASHVCRTGAWRDVRLESEAAGE